MWKQAGGRLSAEVRLEELLGFSPGDSTFSFSGGEDQSARKNVKVGTASGFCGDRSSARVFRRCAGEGRFQLLRWSCGAAVRQKENGMVLRSILRR
ncbi:unnamed protein product [Calypogeia fissa]